MRLLDAALEAVTVVNCDAQCFAIRFVREDGTRGWHVPEPQAMGVGLALMIDEVGRTTPFASLGRATLVGRWCPVLAQGRATLVECSIRRCRYSRGVMPTTRRNSLLI